MFTFTSGECGIRAFNKDGKEIHPADAIQKMADDFAALLARHNALVEAVKETLLLNKKGMQCVTENEAEDWNFKWEAHLKELAALVEEEGK